MAHATADILIVGGGIIGAVLALELKQRRPDLAITLIEKETDFGQHASGRNSGVLHAGFYYSADSLKARFSREGNARWKDFCRERGLALNPCGKLVVTRSEAELPQLEELARRGQANGVTLHEISAREAREIEPRARTVERALWSPTTATVDPRQVLNAVIEEARIAGVVLEPGTAYLGRQANGIRTNRGDWSVGYLVNAAGLYADRIAQEYGFSQDFVLVPFKGLYLYRDEAPTPWLRTHLYPVPDLRNPFLGVHFTVTVSGRVKIGPTAIPAFWREHYRGLERFQMDELVEVLGVEFGLLMRNDFGFRALAVEELRKYSRPHLVRLASALADGVEPGDFRVWGAPGIRAQLYDRRQRRLEMDFRCEGDGQSFHVLNAVSPAFTCALPFGAFLADSIERRMSQAR